MNNERIKSLDGLRGVAILLVLTFHFFTFGALEKIFMFGWMGVDLFFVLSGFFITMSANRPNLTFKNFLIARLGAGMLT